MTQSRKPEPIFALPPMLIGEIEEMPLTQQSQNCIRWQLEQMFNSSDKNTLTKKNGLMFMTTIWKLQKQADQVPKMRSHSQPTQSQDIANNSFFCTNREKKGGASA